MNKILSKWKLRAMGVAVPIVGGLLILISIWLDAQILAYSSLNHYPPESVQVNISVSRSALQQALLNNPNISRDRDILAYLDDSIQECRDPVRPAQSSRLLPDLLEDRAVQEEYRALTQHLRTLREVTLERWEAHRQGADTSALAERYRLSFEAALASTHGVRHAVHAAAAHRRSCFIWVNASALICLFGLFSWSGLMLYRELKTSRQQTGDLAKLSLVANKTDNLVLITDDKGQIEWVNEGFTRLTGRSLQEVMGKQPGEILLGAARNPHAIETLREGLTRRRTFSLEMLCAHRTGRHYWLSLHVNPVCNAAEELINYVGIGADITGRKRAEEELARVNRQNELLLSAAGEGICGLDLQGSITFVNPAAARLTGWDPHELIGRSVSTILHQLRVNALPGSSENQFAGLAFKDGSVLIGDNDLFQRRDKSNFPVEYTSTPIHEGNRLVGTVVVFKDITDRKQTELMRTRQARQFALRAEIGFALTAGSSLRTFLQQATETLLRQFDSALARLWVFRAEENQLELQASAGLYTHLDGQHGRIPLGALKVGVLAKQRLPQITNDLSKDPDVVDKDWVRRERLTAFVGFPLLMHNRLVGVLALYSRQRLPDDTLELLGGVSDSLSQGILRKRAEEKVAEQAALLDKAQDAILVADLENRCVYWNKSAERLYGWEASETYGRRIDELLYREIQLFEKPKEQVLAKGEFREETTHVTKSDKNIAVETQWTLIQDEAGAPKSILLVNTDITERKLIEAQFLRTQRMESIGTLAGGIAHDLNNVLAPIMMSVDILKQRFTDDQSQRMLSIVESSTRRGADMVKQVLTFARGVEGERMLLQPRHLLKEITKMVSETFPKTIKLRNKIAEQLPAILGDATQLHQVLVNLTVNARDAMPNGGTITIEAGEATVDTIPEGNPHAQPGPYVIFAVADTGTGIPRDVLDKIFEPFFTTKDVGKGTGLGLSTVLGIIKSHGGFIQVQTENNKGTTFTIGLPAAGDNSQFPAEAENRTLPTGHGELILAVDDEAAVLSMTKETLETYGYRVLTATDGAEAVATFTAHRNDIKTVLTDMLMPNMDGPATIRVLKKLAPKLRVIAASGLFDLEKVKDATGLDHIAFLNKPYTVESLLKTVNQVLQETKAEA